MRRKRKKQLEPLESKMWDWAKERVKMLECYPESTVEGRAMTDAGASGGCPPASRMPNGVTFSTNTSRRIERAFLMLENEADKKAVVVNYFSGLTKQIELEGYFYIKTGLTPSTFNGHLNDALMQIWGAIKSTRTEDNEHRE